MDFCTSVRFFGLVGLSGPMPPTVEQNVPDVKQMGASAARYTPPRGARAACGETACGEGRAPVFMSPPTSTPFSPPLFTFTVFIAVGTAPMFPPPLDSA